MDISIIIVNYNTRDLLEKCLESVFGHTSGFSFEVILVDNASTDDSVAMVRQRFSGVQVIPLEENIGFGNANNRGVAEASGDYLFFLNSDTMLRDNAIHTLWNFMKNNPCCGIAGGNLVNFEGTPIHSYSIAFPGPFADLSRFFRKFHKVVYGKSWEYNYTGKPMSVAYVTGADLMIRRELFLEAGGFDPDFFMYYEETELSYRIKRRGYTIYSVPDAVILHKKGGSLHFAQDTRETIHTSKYLYLGKVYGAPAVPVAHICFYLYGMSREVLYRIKGNEARCSHFAKLLRTEKKAYDSVRRTR